MKVDKEQVLNEMKNRLSELRNMLQNDNLKSQNKIKREIEHIELCIKEGYIILGEYINHSTKIKMMCDKGHIVDTIAPSRFKSGRRCKECFNIQRKEIMRNSKKSIEAREKFYRLAEEVEYTILGDYESDKQPVKMMCNKGHITDTLTPGSFRSGSRCKICYELNRGDIKKNSERVKKAKEDFYKLAGEEGYTILGEYIRSDKSISMKCPYGHITNTLTPNNFKRGARCKSCYDINISEIARNRDSSIKAKEEFYMLVENEGYELVGEYINNSTHVELICPKGHKHSPTPNDFKSGCRCGTCYELNRKNIINNTQRVLEAKEEFYKLAQKEGFKVLGEYVNTDTNIKMKCPQGHIIDTLTPHGFKAGNRCKICYDLNRSKIYRNIEKNVEAKEEFYQMTKERGYRVIGEYINNSTGVKMECPKGHITDTLTPNSFKRGNECLTCGEENRKNLIKEFYELAESEGFSIIDEYIDATTKINIMCPKGHIYSARPNDFKSGYRCPECLNKYGENKCRDVLDLYNIKYERERTFEGLVGVGGGNLKFDFYLPELNIVIEIQGEGHFPGETILHKGNTIEHDKIKRKWCKNNNITMKEIPYITRGKGNSRKKALEKIEIEIKKFLDKFYN